jgi:hypothetical protein
MFPSLLTCTGTPRLNRENFALPLFCVSKTVLWIPPLIITIPVPVLFLRANYFKDPIMSNKKYLFKENVFFKLQLIKMPTGILRTILVKGSSPFRDLQNLTKKKKPVCKAATRS